MRVAIKLFGRFTTAKNEQRLFVTFPLSAIEYIMHLPNDAEAHVMLRDGSMFEVSVKGDSYDLTNRGELDSLLTVRD